MQPGIPTSKKGKFDSEMNPLSGIPMVYIKETKAPMAMNPLFTNFYSVCIIVEESGTGITHA